MTEDEAHAAKHAGTPVMIRGGLSVWTITDPQRESDGQVRASLHRPGGAPHGYRRYHVSLHRLEVAS